MDYARRVKQGLEEGEISERVPSDVAFARQRNWEALEIRGELGIEIKWARPIDPWILPAVSPEDFEYITSMKDNFRPRCPNEKAKNGNHRLRKSHAAYGFIVACTLCEEGYSCD